MSKKLLLSAFIIFFVGIFSAAAESSNVMILHDMEAEAGELITVEIEIQNDDPFVGFNLDVPLPGGFTYVEGSEQLFRSNNHSLSFSVNPSNVAKIISFSMVLNEYTGNDGVILSFDVQTPHVPGDYLFEIVSPTIGNINAQNILTGKVDGNLILTGDDPVDVFSLMLNSNPPDAGTPSGAGEYPAGTDINIGASAYDGYAFVNWTDAGGNEVSASASFIYTMPAADATLTANFQETEEPDPDAENVMKVHTVIVQTGGIATIEIEIHNDLDFVGFNVDLPIPEGFEYVEHSEQLFREDGEHEFGFSITDAGVAKIIGYSLTNSAFEGNEGVIFSFDVIAPETEGEFPLELIDAVIGNIHADNILTGTVDGMIHVESTAPEQNIIKIHDVEANTGDVITVEIEILNTDAFVGFNLDIPLPQGFEYVAETEELHRKTDHEFVFNVLEATNTVKIIAFSTSNDAFPGNDGVIFSFDVQTPIFPGEYILPVVDGIIGNVDAENILTGTIHGNVALEGEPVFNLTLLAEPEEGGEVTGEGAFIAGDMVEVDAIPNEGWAFVEWRDDAGVPVSDEPFNIIEMPAEDLTLIAHFAMIEYTLTLLAEPEEGGQVTGAGTYNLGEMVDVDAIPGEGWEFVEWTDEAGVTISGEPFNTIEITGDLTLIAHFAMIEYTLTLLAEPEEGGQVTGAGTYNLGEMVDVDAIPNEGWEFVEWTDEAGATISGEPFNTIEITGDLTLIAHFVMIDYTLTLLAEPEEGGQVTGAGSYNFGETAEVNAIPNEGWGFINWTDEAGLPVSDEAFNTIEMPAGDLTLFANFELLTFKITFVVTDAGTGDAIDNAVISLNDVEYDTGVYEFEDLLPGEYNYIVSFEGYFPEDGSITISDQDEIVEVELTLDDVSVHDADMHELSIFPNPASSVMNIESNQNINDLRLIDMLGQVVYHATVDDLYYEINVSSFRNGIYFVQVNTASGISTHRVQIVN